MMTTTSFLLKRGKHATRLFVHAKQPNKLVRSFDRASEDSLISSYGVVCLVALPYKWTQQLMDVDITVPVPKGTRGRDLNVVIQKKKLSVGLKGKEPIMAGELCNEIKVDESTWTLGEYVPCLLDKRILLSPFCRGPRDCPRSP